VRQNTLNYLLFKVVYVSFYNLESVHVDLKWSDLSFF